MGGLKRIGVVGLGLVGGSIALGARRAWPEALVIGVDRTDVLERAMRLHAVDVAGDELLMLRDAELVVLAAPIEQNIRVLGELAAHVPGEAIVTDTGSTKRLIVDAARSLPDRLEFVGGHPLGGGATSGVEHARPDLFAGRPWLLTPSARGRREVPARLIEFVRGLGARPRVLDADTHDRLLAAASHLPQLVASALMHVVGELVGENGLSVSGSGLRDTTRLAASPAAIWRDICRTNGDRIAEALDAMVAALGELKDDLDAGEALERVFGSSVAWRRRLADCDPDGAREAGPGEQERVRVRKAALDDIEAHAREARPNECCGLLIGSTAEIHEVVRARNLLASPTRYRIDPEDHFAAIRRARAAGRQVIGAYHSHTGPSATPSARDVAEAHDPGFLNVIVAPASGAEPADIRAFRMIGPAYEPVELVSEE